MSMPKTGKVVLKSQEQLYGAGQLPWSDFMEETVFKQLFAVLNVSFSLTPITMWFHKAQMQRKTLLEQGTMFCLVSMWCKLSAVSQQVPGHQQIANNKKAILDHCTKWQLSP